MNLFYADVRKKYGSRGVAQAKKIKEQTTALFAGGELSEEDQAAFIKEMEALSSMQKLMRRNLLQKNICGKESHLLRRKGVYFEHTHN